MDGALVGASSLWPNEVTIHLNTNNLSKGTLLHTRKRYGLHFRSLASWNCATMFAFDEKDFAHHEQIVRLSARNWFESASDLRWKIPNS